MPEMIFDEILETSQIYSAGGMLDEQHFLVSDRPFRAPHTSVSAAGLIGGSSIPRPGEVSLAHNGILFLDELPEFHHSTLELLRQPLSDGTVTISRARSTATFPARFLLVAACNPCPCGYFFDPVKRCSCTHDRVHKYMTRLSGPLLDRIDLQIEVQRLSPDELIDAPCGESSQDISIRVKKAWEIQRSRFKDTGFSFNSRMQRKELDRHCALNAESGRLLRQCVETMGLSARAYDKILRLSRTIADLEGVEKIAPSHVAEAVQYRFFDRKKWY